MLLASRLPDGIFNFTEIAEETGLQPFHIVSSFLESFLTQSRTYIDVIYQSRFLVSSLHPTLISILTKRKQNLRFPSKSSLK